MMVQWKETSKVQIRFARGWWYIIWPVPMQYRLTGKRCTVVDSYEQAIKIACRMILFSEWKIT